MSGYVGYCVDDCTVLLMVLITVFNERVCDYASCADDCLMTGTHAKKVGHVEKQLGTVARDSHQIEQSLRTAAGSKSTMSVQS